MPVQQWPTTVRLDMRRRDAAMRPSVLMLAAIVLACMCVARGAEFAQPAPPIAFDIPAQPLPNALHAFGRTVGSQVLYESRSAAGRYSLPVHGLYTPDEALKHLLAGTDLQIRHATADAVTLVAPATSATLAQDLPPLSPLADVDLSLGELRVRATVRPNDLERYADYSETVRADIQHALLKNAMTASGNYRAVLDLWIAPDRTIRRATLLQPTGEAIRDAAVTSTLRGLTLSRPTPADAPQPIRAVVAVSTAR